jgi:hypothetical protein
MLLFVIEPILLLICLLCGGVLLAVSCPDKFSAVTAFICYRFRYDFVSICTVFIYKHKTKITISPLDRG